jgi:hypothetical protein
MQPAPIGAGHEDVHEEACVVAAFVARMELGKDNRRDRVEHDALDHEATVQGEDGVGEMEAR